jgi:hypothetical protein
VYFYRQLGAGIRSRFSGNGGNQVGRLCLEGVSIRGADVSLLDATPVPSALPSRSWVFDHVPRDADTFLQALVWKELHWPVVGNAVLGASFCAQYAPYLAPSVLRGALANPEIPAYSASFNPRTARWRDIRHRMLGMPRRRSWQRELLARRGGALAQTVVNLGWYPGRFSPRSLLSGPASLLDLYTYKQRRFGALLHRAALLLGSTGRVNTTDYKTWTRSHLREFILDLLRSQSVRESGIFRNERLTQVCEQFFDQQQSIHFDTIVSAVDVALAHQTFIARR